MKPGLKMIINSDLLLHFVQKAYLCCLQNIREVNWNPTLEYNHCWYVLTTWKITSFSTLSVFDKVKNFEILTLSIWLCDLPHCLWLVVRLYFTLLITILQNFKLFRTSLCQLNSCKYEWSTMILYIKKNGLLWSCMSDSWMLASWNITHIQKMFT